MHTTQTPSETAYTEQHERIHEKLVWNTSLGSLAFAVRAIKMKWPDAFKSKLTDAFISAYVIHTRLAHEGFAIAQGMLISQGALKDTFPSTEQIKRIHPPDEIAVAEHILTKAECVAFHLMNYFQYFAPLPENLNLYRNLASLIVQATGTLILSPEISLDDAADAFRSPWGSAYDLAASVWRRLTQLLGFNPPELAKAIFNDGSTVLGMNLKRTCVPPIDDEFADAWNVVRAVIVGATSRTLGMSYGAAVTLNQLLENFYPGATTGIENVDSPPLGWLEYTQLFAVHEPLVPKVVSRNEVILQSVSLLEDKAFIQEGRFVAEYSITLIGTREDEHNKMMGIWTGPGARLFGPGFTFVLLIYEYNKNWVHLATRVFFDPSMADLEMIASYGRKRHDVDKLIPDGLIVSIEDLATSGRFRSMIIGLELLVTTKRAIGSSHFNDHKIVGTAHGATLCEATLIDGRKVWSLVAVGYDPQRRELEGADSAVVWALRNGSIATEKWKIFANFSGGSNEA